MTLNKKAKKRRNNKTIFVIIFGGLFLVLITPLVAVSMFLIVYFGFVRPYEMSGNSMYPTYKSGAYLMTDLRVDKENLIKGDIVVFKPPNRTNIEFVKRIIGIPGDELMFKEGEVILNGEKLEEPYLYIQSDTNIGKEFKENELIVIPDGMYFVMGDNRAYSSDSREFGFVPAENIVSVVDRCYYNCE